MKNIITLCVLASAIVIGQSCAPKTDKAAVEIAATRAKIAKASAEKEAQTKLVIAEKAKPTSTYKDASGKIVTYKADVDASYTGGFDELRQSRKNNLTHPEATRENGHEGTLLVDFTVDEKGRIWEVVTEDPSIHISNDSEFLILK